MSSGWQEEALARAMAANRRFAWSDRMEIVLRNPAEEQRLDDLICKELWPMVRRALRGTGLSGSTGAKRNVRANIRGKPHQYVCRGLTVVLVDPKRPIGPGTSPPWYFRVEFDVSTHGYRVGRDTSLSFPVYMQWVRLKKLLTDPALQGYPPQLSWESKFGGQGGEFCLSFSGTSGGRWDPSDADVAEQLDEIGMERGLAGLGESTVWNEENRMLLHDAALFEMRGHARIAAAMDKLARDWKSDELLEALRHSILEFYLAV